MSCAPGARFRSPGWSMVAWSRQGYRAATKRCTGKNQAAAHPGNWSPGLEPNKPLPPSLGCSWGRSHHIFLNFFLVEDRITGSTSLSIGEPQRVAASSRSGRAIPGPADWQQHFVNKTQLLTDHQPTLVYVHQATTQVRCTISHGCYRWL
jgi:hypothetical protein